ncbi:MAG TPA: NAD(P)/FAD-dependent oxidoreductase [Thermoanaerobaculia bacterium]|nr:NAD(P)/FAD-dependent oxidoreductase [Thermoanaerobaculia bacterium]
MQYDTAIVGAGLAGLHLAHLLGSRGLRVVLIDRRPSIATPIHTTGIFVRRTWEDFPLPEEQLGPPIRDVILHSPALRRLTLRSAADEFRIARMEWLYLALLERCSRAGVAWIPGAAFLSWQPGELAFVRRGLRIRCAARFVVGADGARSAVAAQLGLDRNREFLAGVEQVVACSAPPALHCFLDPQLAPGYIGWIAADGRTAHIGLAGYPSRFDPSSALAEFRARVAHIADGAVLERRGGLIPVNGILRRIANGSGLLVGDAAGAVSPLTAGGFDAALRLSAFAADVVTGFLDRGDPAVLRTYDGARLRSQTFVRRCLRRAMRVPWPSALIEAGFDMLEPLARRVFFGRGLSLAA